jgi:TM2 domain-containing membrane protein YozV
MVMVGETEFFLFLVVFVVIVAAVLLTRKSRGNTIATETLFSQIIQQVPADKQILFLMQYNSIKKNSTTAVLLAVFLGGLGVHKFYMEQPGIGILYLLFCWTGIPEVLGILEALTISNSVAEYNQKLTQQIAVAYGATSLGSASMTYK